MAPPAELTALAADWRLQQQTVAARVTVIGRRLWGQVDGGNVLASFDGAVARSLLTALTAGQLAAADGAQGYVEAALEAQGVDPDPFGAVNGRALAGVASDGRSLDGLLRQPAQDTVGRLAAGVDVDQALASGLAQLERMLATQIADASRNAVQVGMVNDRQVKTYVRMVTAPSCSRCVVLAGRVYRTQRAFKRHPHCDCVMIPSAEDSPDDWHTDPQAYFNRLSTAEQDKAFTKAGAQAVRDGGDLSRVVNARRGMATSGESLTGVNADGRTVNVRHRTLSTTRVAGRDVATTTEATTRRGVGRKVRLMPEQIYAEAADRAEQIRLLKVHGYIL